MGHDQKSGGDNGSRDRCITVGLVRKACSPNAQERDEAWQVIATSMEFGRVVEMYLEACVYRQGLHFETSDDLFQQTLQIAFKRLVTDRNPRARAWLLDPDQTLEEARLLRWLYTIAKNVVKNAQKKQKRMSRRISPLEDHAYRVSDGKPGLEARYVREEEQAAASDTISHAAESLSEPHHERLDHMWETLITSPNGDDLNISELARQTNQSRTVYYRTLRRMKQIIEQQNPNSYNGGENNG